MISETVYDSENRKQDQKIRDKTGDHGLLIPLSKKKTFGEKKQVKIKRTQKVKVKFSQSLNVNQ